jgi:hypothetical protein
MSTSTRLSATTPLTALSRAHERGGVGGELCAPMVGRLTLDARLSVAPRAGESAPVWVGGERVGTLEVAGRRVGLRLPADLPPCHLTPRSRAPVALGYGEVWASWSPAGGGAEVSGGGEGAQGAEGGRAFEAPIEGTVYFSPSPDAPAFVTEGAEVRAGQVVALIEVMKFFYEIKYEGPAPARFLRRAATDAAPIEAGAALYWIAPGS